MASWIEGRETAWMYRRTDERMDGWTDRQMDGRTDRFLLCSTGLCPLRGRCPAPLPYYSSRAWVPLTTYCLWAAISVCMLLNSFYYIFCSLASLYVIREFRYTCTCQFLSIGPRASGCDIAFKHVLACCSQPKVFQVHLKICHPKVTEF